MKVAKIYCARATGAAFSWKWRSADGKHESPNHFDYYYDCCEDARKNGYTAEFSPAKNPAGAGTGERAK